MPQIPRTSTLRATRKHIASEVRALRRARGWTLADLAKHLVISPSRLSEVERGDGSFTAEQFLAILTLFNVPATHFSRDRTSDATDQLQNALARLGATNLQENRDLTPSEQLRFAHQVIREALVEGSPRLITAVAPLLVRNLDSINTTLLYAELAELGYAKRLGWVVDNTIDAIARLPAPWSEDSKIRHARSGLFFFARTLHNRLPDRTIEDVLDRSIRTQKTLDQVRRDSSSISKAWNIVTSIGPEDFDRALRASLAHD